MSDRTDERLERSAFEIRLDPARPDCCDDALHHDICIRKMSDDPARHFWQLAQ
jgi:hypothetical protein